MGHEAWGDSSLVVPTLLVFPAPACHTGPSRVQLPLNWLVVASGKTWQDRGRQQSCVLIWK